MKGTGIYQSRLLGPIILPMCKNDKRQVSLIYFKCMFVCFVNY